MRRLRNSTVGFALLAAVSCGPSAPTIELFEVSPRELSGPGIIRLDWRVADSDFVSINVVGEDVDPDGIGLFVEVDPPVVVTLLARNKAGETSKSIEVRDTQPHIQRVSGTIVDKYGVGVPSAPVRIDGEQVLTDASGSFEVLDVRTPYDVVIGGGFGFSWTRYSGLTGTSLVLVDFYAPPREREAAVFDGVVQSSVAPGTQKTLYANFSGDSGAPFAFGMGESLPFVQVYERWSGESAIDLLAFSRTGIRADSIGEFSLQEDVPVSTEGISDAGTIVLEPISSTKSVDVVLDAPAWAPSVTVMSSWARESRSPVGLELPWSMPSGGGSMTLPVFPSGTLFVEALASRTAPPSCGCAGSAFARSAVTETVALLELPDVVEVSPTDGQVVAAPVIFSFSSPGSACVVRGSHVKGSQRPWVVVTSTGSLDLSAAGVVVNSGDKWLLEASCFGPFSSIDEAGSSLKLQQYLLGRGVFFRSTAEPVTITVQ